MFLRGFLREALKISWRGNVTRKAIRTQRITLQPTWTQPQYNRAHPSLYLWISNPNDRTKKFCSLARVIVQRCTSDHIPSGNSPIIVAVRRWPSHDRFGDIPTSVCVLSCCNCFPLFIHLFAVVYFYYNLFTHRSARCRRRRPPQFSSSSSSAVVYPKTSAAAATPTSTTKVSFLYSHVVSQIDIWSG